MVISMMPFQAAAEELTEEVIIETVAEELPVEEPTEAAIEEVSVEEPTEAATEEVPVEEPTEAATEEAPVEESTEAATEEEPTEATEEELIVEEIVDTPVEEVAETKEGKWTYGNNISLADELELPSDEELFAGYVDSVFYGADSVSRPATFGTAAGKRLSGDAKKLYDALVPLIRNVANGKRSSTTFIIGASSYGPDKTVTFTQSYATLYNQMRNLYSALLTDLAYEQYWHDKTTGISWGYATSDGSEYGTLEAIQISFTVAYNYSSNGQSYVASTSKTGAAANSAANAKSIVNTYEDYSDYNKLKAYKDKICAMVSYDHDAVNYGDFSYDNDPWQLIHAFDNDSSTNIVCEGYSKAFMYLCDLSDFSGDVTCTTVTGNAGGPHMWNVVTIERNNYLVDVTNSDSGSIGQNGGLFLNAPSYGSVTSGYNFLGINFYYDEDTTNLWGTGSSSILNLSNRDYARANLKATNVASSGKIKLTWNAMSGAKEYKIYRATSKNGSYSLMYTTTKTSYTNTSAVAGKTYYYKVSAIDASGNSYKWGDIVSKTCDLARPVVKATNVASSGKIKLTWDKVSGAEKYYVYRATSKNGTYKYMLSTTNTSYTNTSAKAGYTYYYKVKAVDSNEYGNSANSSVVSKTCDLARPVVSIALSSSGKPKLTWKAIDGAAKYYIYRSTSKSGTYSYLSSTTKTSFTNTGAKAGTTYYYKVKAICERSSYGNSAYSYIDSIKSK